MKFKDLIELLSLDEGSDDETRDREIIGYRSWTIPDRTVLLIQSDIDNEWYRGTYVQLIYADSDYPTDTVCIQLEGLPEDPLSLDHFEDIPVKVFQQVS